MKRLNGWQRIGIIASVLWAVGAFLIVGALERNSAFSFNERMFLNCVGANTYETCNQESMERTSHGMSAANQTATLAAFAPIPLAWGFVYLCLWLTRWVRRGFQ